MAEVQRDLKTLPCCEDPTVCRRGSFVVGEACCHRRGSLLQSSSPTPVPVPAPPPAIATTIDIPTTALLLPAPSTSWLPPVPVVDTVPPSVTAVPRPRLHLVVLKRPPQFQGLFDQTHKKKGTDDDISQKAREVAESYSRGMDERYGDDSQRPELNHDIWVAAFGAPKKGHVYGFGHSLGTARVISSCSSSVSHATSPFTTHTAPGGSSSAAPTMTPAQFREIVNKTVSQNISTIVSQTVSQTLAQLGILGDRAPPALQPPIRILFD
ncbi:hypothetical protein Taro_031117 [Colocasia esculenta]|uniref:Uncharacterized protein n=1 Tax=Colocasia esculenta TaxID=4460 RepID=A0A843W269_COLES|nr:hypothetical protein [Colocasia esculenta]